MIMFIVDKDAISTAFNFGNLQSYWTLATACVRLRFSRRQPVLSYARALI